MEKAERTNPDYIKSEQIQIILKANKSIKAEKYTIR